MIKLSFILLAYSLSFFIIKTGVYALVINEVYPAPASGDYEWIELFNNEDKDINLSEYHLTDEKDKKINTTDSSITSGGYTTATTSSVLNNNGDTVYLRKDNEIIDTVRYSGSYTSSHVYARCPDGGNWMKLSLKSPGVSNTSICPTPPPTENLDTPISQNSPTPTQIPIKPSPTRSPTDKPQTYNNIYISEVFPRPSDGFEWIELYNNNNNSVTLTNWAIDDIEDGGSKPIRFSTSISKGGYYILEFTKYILNNSGDSVRLIDFEETEIDYISYEGAEIDKSFGRLSFDSKNVCLQDSSKKKKNNSCIEKGVDSSSEPKSGGENTTPTISLINSASRITDDPAKNIEYVFITTPESRDEIKEKRVLGTISKKQKNKPLKYKREIIYLSLSAIFFSGFNITYILYRIDRKMRQ